MKSRTLSCNLTVLKKDITRFAPAWILYTVGLLVTLMVCHDSNSHINYTIRSLAGTGHAMAIVNFCYALLNVQLLFGDLFNPRMTNALHALPLRRESWFAVHVVSGLLFALVPNLLMALAMAMFSGSVPAMPWLWLLWAMGQYVFYFGLAALCAMCVGSRFAMVVVYGIINFASLLACWLYDTVFLPMLYGLTQNFEAFLKFCPVAYGTVNVPFTTDITDFNGFQIHLTTDPEMFTYLGILTVLGVVMGALALVMYRKRHLESAGDFISAEWLKPIFLVLYTMAMGIVFQWILGLFTGTDWLYLFIGLLVGFFTGQMLLMRTVRIFVKQTFIGMLVLLLVTAASLGLTALDPLGVTRWVPDANEVAHVQVGVGGAALSAEAGGDLELLLEFHQTILDNRDEDTTVKERKGTSITYTMKDGRTVERYYTIPTLGTAHMLLEPMLSRPEVILGELYENWNDLRGQVEVSDSQGDDILWFNHNQWETFIAAVEKDCAEGTLIQDRHFHSDHSVYSLYFRWRDTDERGITFYRWVPLEIYGDSTHTLAWLEAQDWYGG